MLTLEMICQAQHRLRGLLQRPPLVHSSALSSHLGAQVYLKLEFLQKTGSFKPRGAFNKMLTLSAEERQRGVVAVSGGNHAQGVAYAARQLGISAVIAKPIRSTQNGSDFSISSTTRTGVSFMTLLMLTTDGERSNALRQHTCGSGPPMLKAYARLSPEDVRPPFRNDQVFGAGLDSPVVRRSDIAEAANPAHGSARHETGCQTGRGDPA